MLFNSISFAIFLPIVFLLYWTVSYKYRWILLLIASYYFYMSWKIKYVILILVTTFVSYLAAYWIEKESSVIRRKRILIATIIVCMGILFFFKYFNFASESIVFLLGMFSIQLHPITLKFLLPVGISFYIFQTLSYVIDVYRGKVRAEHNFGIYATFISFFPQLVAGPIERTENLLPQIKSKKQFNYKQAIYGLKLMLWGYFKKTVVADGIAGYVDIVYANPTSYRGVDFLIASFFFSVQIYCDFSGYSDIAIGTAKLLGVELMTNFKSPYFSSSIKEFWSRWHISLSTWFRDYVYIAIGGNRCSKIKCTRNVIITFLVSGLWHGANWTYLVWGGIHGLAQVMENIFWEKLQLIRKNRFVKVILTLLVFIFCNMAWILFRANTLLEAVYIMVHMFEGFFSIRDYIQINIGMSWFHLIYLFGLIIIVAVYDWKNYSQDFIVVASRNRLVEWGIYVIMGLMVIFLSQKGMAAEFVYFQF